MKKHILFIFFLLLTIIYAQGQISTERLISNHIFPYDAKAYDIDGDGDMDILAGAINSKVVWFKNLGGGSFSQQKIISTSINSPIESINAADFDNDGDLDVVCAYRTANTIAWYKNQGGGIFDSTPNIISTTDNGAYAVSSADLDGDGDIDVLSAALNSNAINFYNNLGGGVFSSWGSFPSVSQASDVFPVDVDLDGDMDVLYSAKASNKLAWRENLGGWSFSAEKIITLNANGIYGIYSADLDGDGDMDVLSASDNDGKIAWYENLGTGVIDTTQKIITTAGVNTRAVYAADLDGDGDLDVIANDSGMLVWYENLGGGIISTTQTIIDSNPGTQVLYSVCAADFDGDNDNEILCSYGTAPTAKVALYNNLGAATFSSQQLISCDMDSPYEILSADIDGDGDKDIVCANQNTDNIIWIENNGGHEFGAQHIVANQINLPEGIYSTDLDGDGDIDVLSASYSDNKIAWFENVGGGIMDTIQHIISSNTYHASDVYAADFDNDGDMDVLTLSNPGMLVWYENLGGGIIDSLKHTVSTIVKGGQDIKVVDIDNDGNKDIISSSITPNKLGWFKNLGGGIFDTTQILISTSLNYVKSINCNDMDGDGDQDVIALSQLNDIIVWYENLGTGVISLSPNTITRLADGPTCAFATDIDQDGDMDVLSTSAGDNKVAWYENLGAGVFDTLVQHIINSSASGPYYVIGTDLDGDGDMDIVSSHTWEHEVVWYENYYYAPKLKGQIFYDVNQNALRDSNDIPLPFIQAVVQPNGLYSFTDVNGGYLFATDTGNYVISYTNTIDSLWGLTTDSVTYTKTLINANQIIDSLDFGFYPDTIITILEPNLVGGYPRCNQIVNYWIDIHNGGTTISNGIIKLQLDNLLNYSSSDVLPDSIIGQNIYWHCDSLFFYSDKKINAKVVMPTFNNQVTSYISVYEIDSMNNIIYSNKDSLTQLTFCAYDPNDKNVTPKGLGPQGYVSNDQELEYLIRFQNTGNDTALTIIIRDQLDENLDWSTLQPVSSSDPMQVWIEQSGEAVFKFNNIMLPDSGTDFLGSQGFVKFKINMKPNLLPGTQITNQAGIYFDYNPPVITNGVLNTIYDCTLMNFNLNPITMQYCQYDTVNVFYNDGDDFNNHGLSIDGFYTNSIDPLYWYADTSGVFDLKFSTSNQFCFIDTTITLTIFPAIPTTSISQFICQGDSILLGGSFQTSMGIYNDTLQSVFGCDSILSTSLAINPLPNVSVASFTPDTLCDNGSPIALPAGVPGGGVYSGIGVSGGNFDPSAAGVGTYPIIYTYTDSNICLNSDTTIVTVKLCVGISETSNDFGILIYPNPNTGKFTVEKPRNMNKEVQVKLLDATSKLIIDETIPIGKQKLKMDITHYSKDIYYLQLMVDDKVFVKQILRN